MAKARCQCGHEHDVPNEELGEVVACRACGDTFVARPIGAEAAGETADRGERPAAPPPPRLGELAVERALVSHEHVELCARIQEELRRQGLPGKRIGEILIEKGLVKPHQIDDLLSQQAGEPPKKPFGPHKPPPKPVVDIEPEPDVPAARREAPKPAKAEGGRRLRWAVAAVGLLAAAGAAVAFWPRASARRALAAYLDSCREGARKPKADLAIADPGFVIRDFRVLALPAATRLDYGAEVRGFTHGKRGSWRKLLETATMADDKRAALELVLPLLAKAPRPDAAGTLTVTLQPVDCHLFVKERAERFFRQGRYRLTMVRVETSAWDSGWRLAGCARSDEPSP